MKEWWGHILYLSSGLGAWFYINNSDFYKAPIVQHKLEGERSEKLEENLGHEIEKRQTIMEARIKELEEMEIKFQELQRTGDAANAAKHDELLKMEAKLKQMEANEAPKDPATKCPQPAPRANGATDPFSELWDASSRSVSLIKQAASFACETIVAKIWPWPVDSLFTVPDFDVAARVQQLLAKPELKAIHDVLALSSQKLSVASTKVGRLRVADPLLSAFRHRFPEQQNFDGGREPLHVLFLFFVLVILAAWNLYGIWSLFASFVKRVLCCPCRMCRGSGVVVDNAAGRQRTASSGSETSEPGTPAGTPASGKRKPRHSNGKK